MRPVQHQDKSLFQLVFLAFFVHVTLTRACCYVVYDLIPIVTSVSVCAVNCAQVRVWCLCAYHLSFHIAL